MSTIQKKVEDFKIPTAAENIRASLRKIGSNLPKLASEFFWDGIARHNYENNVLLARRDSIVRGVREFTRGDYSTIARQDPLMGFYKFTVGGKSYSLKELAETVDPDFGRTANFFALHDGAYMRWLKNEKKLTDFDKKQIAKAYMKLKLDFEERNPGKDFYLAVRSSGTLIGKDLLPIAGGEDSKDNAFAGMNETLLNISDVDSLYTAVEYCFGQCGNDAVVAYMEKKGIDASTARLPLTVQEMVRSTSFSDLAGIVFSKAKIQEKSDDIDAPIYGSVAIISGMNEYAVGGQATRYIYKFDNRTGKIIDFIQQKQQRALLANPFRISKYDTNLDIALPGVMQERLDLIQSSLVNEEYTPDFIDAVKTSHLIKVDCPTEVIVKIAQNLISHTDELMNLSFELDNIDADDSTKPTEQYVQSIINQVLIQRTKFGYEADMEFVGASSEPFPTFLQIRSLTGNAVAIEKGPECELPVFAKGLIASPGVTIGKMMYLDFGRELTRDDLFDLGVIEEGYTGDLSQSLISEARDKFIKKEVARYKEAAAAESVIPVFPIADVVYTPIETDENCPGAIALTGTPNGHAGIIASEISALRPVSGFPYIVGLRGPKGETITNFADMCKTYNVNDGEVVTLNCWSPEVGDGLIHSGKDQALEDKWIDFWSNNQYKIMEPVIRPDGQKVNIGAIVSIPEAVQAVSDAGFDYIGLFRLETIYKEGIDDERLPEDMRNTPCHPMEYFDRGFGHVFEDHLFNRIKVVIDGFPDKVITIRAFDAQGPDMDGLKFADKHTKHEEAAGALIGDRGAYLFRTNPELFNTEANVIRRILGYIKEREMSTTIKYMYPFFRSASDVEVFVKLKEDHSLVDGENGLRLGVMLEVPSITFMKLMADKIKSMPKIIELFNGELPFSFGSIGMNDYVQLFLSRYRNNAELLQAYSQDEGSVYEGGISNIQTDCKEIGLELYTCGDAAGKNAKVREFLYRIGVKNIGVSPAYLGPTHSGLMNLAEKQKNARNFVLPFFSKLKV
jgi:hypothetical protein